MPFLNFTTKCADYGRYVIFYNERLDEVSYPTGYILDNSFTELCEVIVKGKLKKNNTALVLVPKLYPPVYALSK